MRLSVASLRRVVKRDLPIEFVPQQLTSYGGLELLRRYLQRVDLSGRLRRALGRLGSDYGSARLSLLVLALFYVGGRRPEHLQYLAGDPLVRRFCGLARVPTARTVGNWLRTVHPDDVDRAEPAEPRTGDRRGRAAQAAAPDDRRRWHGGPDRRDGRLGLPGLQSPSSEGPELLPAPGPSRPDRSHPAAEEPARERPRLHPGRRLPARADHRSPRPARPARRPGVPHGRRIFPAECVPPARAPGLWVCHQGRLLELAAAQAAGGRDAPLGAGRPRRHRLRDDAGRPSMEPAPPGDALSPARPAPEPPQLPTRSLHPGRWPLRVPRRGHEPVPQPAGALCLHRRAGARRRRRSRS